MSIENRPTERAIMGKLTTQFAPSVLNIVNESHMHSSGRGAESHFKVTIVSEQFNQMRTVMRHRAIYACLAEELAGSVHALALHTYTPNEWAEQGGIVPNSPHCLGVGQ